MATAGDSADYLRCAEQLRDSIHHYHPSADVTIVTSDQLPWGDQGGQANDWQAWRVSPYRETIKLEADMLVCSEIDHWWDLFRHRDVVISTGCRDWHDRPATTRYYRATFDRNDLPDVYNAITYWRYSVTAREFFQWCQRIWQDWPRYRTLLRFGDATPSTDLVYAMAAVIMGPERVTLPGQAPQICHMKQHVAGTTSEDWRQDLLWEYHDGWLRINTITQWGCFHYVQKSWQP